MVSNMSVLFTILSVFSIRLVVGAYRVIRNKFFRLIIISIINNIKILT